MPKISRKSLGKDTEARKAMNIEKGENMRQAVQKVIDKEMGLMKAAKAYGVSKSALHRKIIQYKNLNDNERQNFTFHRKHGFKQIFGGNEEQLLCDYLLDAARMCYGLTVKNTCDLAYKFAVANKKTIPESWERNKSAGLEWCSAFRKRHPELSLRSPEPTSLSRATSFNKHNVTLFFNNLRAVLDKYKFTANQIYNCDETGVTTVHKPPKIITPSGLKPVGKNN